MLLELARQHSYSRVRSLERGIFRRNDTVGKGDLQAGRWLNTGDPGLRDGETCHVGNWRVCGPCARVGVFGRHAHCFFCVIYHAATSRFPLARATASGLWMTCGRSSRTSLLGDPAQVSGVPRASDKQFACRLSLYSPHASIGKVASAM